MAKPAKKNLDQLCSSALEDFRRNTAKKSVLPHKTAAKSAKPVRYVIEVHTMKTIPESGSVKEGSGSKT